MKLKNALLLLVLTTSSLLFSTGYAQTKSKAVLKQNKTTDNGVKMVVIEGSIKDWKTKKLPTSIKFIENNIVYEEQISYQAKIDAEGKFSISFPKVYGQDIFMVFNENLYPLFVMPGDHIRMRYDPENSNRPFEFTGDNALTNYNIFDYMTKKRNIQTEKSMDAKMNHIVNDSCYVYKEYVKAEAQKDKNFLDGFLSKNTTSDNFKLWAQNDLKYDVPLKLIRYRWEHFYYSNAKEVELPDDYFDFIPEYSINLDQEIISSYFQWYCHELQNMKSFKISREAIRLTPSDIITKLEQKNIKVDPKLKECLKLIKAGEKQNIEECEKLWQALNVEHNKIIREMNEKIPLDIQENFVKKYKVSELVELNQCAELYRNMEKLNTVQSATEIPQKISLIKRASFRNLLSRKYQDFLNDTPNSFNIGGEFLNDKNQSSGDLLLQNILNKHKGKVIYVDFWATWCGPCREEIPYATKLKETLKDKEVVYVYLCGQSDETNWKKLVDGLEMKGDHYFVEKNAWIDLSDKFGVGGIPHYLLIDKNGIVVDKNANRPSSGDLIVNDILKLL